MDRNSLIEMFNEIQEREVGLELLMKEQYCKRLVSDR